MTSTRMEPGPSHPHQMSAGFCLAALVLCLLCVHRTGSEPYAKTSYYMDSDSDCHNSGYLLIREDGVVNIFSRKPSSSSSDVLRCTMRFRPEDDRHIIDVSFTHMTISDKDVTLRVDLTGEVRPAGSGSYTLSSGSSKPNKMDSTGGVASITLSRLNLDDRDYSFGIIIRVYKEDDTSVGEDEKPVGTGLVVGIVAGVIIFLIFIAVLVVCCYRRNKAHYGARGSDDHKQDLTAPYLSPSRSFGLDNVAHNGNYLPRDEEEEDSPPVKKKALPSQRRPPLQRDEPSHSDSDPREGNVSRYNGSPTKPGAVRYEDERENSYRREPPQRMRRRQDVSEDAIRQESSQQQNQNLPPESPILDALRRHPRFRASFKNARQETEERDERENSRREPPQRTRNQQEITDDVMQQEGSQQQNQNLPPKSPILTALQRNPRFRASFQAAEQEAEERSRRISGGADNAAAAEESDLDVSMTETWNTTFDTNFDDDPRPPAGSFIKPPTLPPVPMSPRMPLRHENTATIHRAPRPSSSSSEIEHLQGGGGAEGGVSGVSINPEGEGPPSPSEIVAIRVQDPHSPSIKRKADVQHTLRPDRTKGAKAQEPNNKNLADSQNSDSPRPSPKPKKSASNKPKPKAEKSNTEKKTKTKKPAERENRPSEARNPAPEVKSKPKEAGSEYEGRFRKSDSVRKSKSKSPRIGRSRSAGGGLEDADSMGQPATPRGYRAVPPVTADDYEDSDMESNYNPLRRTGSKNSLYASRSSLYARRRRKNSVGESVYSLVYDDMDYDRRDRDSFKDRSLSRRDRGFKSLGDLEAELRDQQTRSTQTLRECATQTGTGSDVSPGKKIVTKRSKPRSVSSSQTQTAKSKSRNLDSSSSSSGVTRPRERRNSASSTSVRSKSRDRANSASSLGGRKPRKSDTGARSRQAGAEERRAEAGREKPKPKAKPRQQGAVKKSYQSDDNDDMESVRTGMTGPLDHSSMVGASQPRPTGQPAAMYAPHGYPEYPAGYPAHMAYMQATGQPPMVPYPQVGTVPQNTGTVLANPTGVAMLANPSAAVSGPTVAVSGNTARPSASKWDMLCRMTDGDSTKGGGDWNDSASVAGSVFSNPYAPHQFPPGYSSAMSDYAASEQSGPTRSRTGRSRSAGRSAWDTLREMTDQESQYAPSESNI